MKSQALEQEKHSTDSSLLHHTYTVYRIRVCIKRAIPGAPLKRTGAVIDPPPSTPYRYLR